MKAELTLKLGNKMLKIVGEGDHTSIIKNLSFWSQLPENCSKCKSNTLSLFHRKAKDSKGREVNYFGIKCLSCDADFTFHEKMDKSGFYTTKDDTFNVYNATAIENKNKDIKEIAQDNDEEIPF